jgi:hypothetical protein
MAVPSGTRKARRALHAAGLFLSWSWDQKPIQRPAVITPAQKTIDARRRLA